MLNSAEHEMYPSHKPMVGILSFISMINSTAEILKARNFFIFRYFSFYEQLKYHAQLSWAWKKLYNLGAWLRVLKLISFLLLNQNMPL